jgi:hypothetical protein
MDKRKRPGFFVAVDQRCWSDEKLASISKGARWTWVALTSWSKDQGRDGRVTARALKHTDAEPGEVDELVKVGLLKVDGDDWILPDFAAWQMTTSEIAHLSEVRRKAGKRGAAARHGKAAAAKPAPVEDLGNASDEDEEDEPVPPQPPRDGCPFCTDPAQHGPCCYSEHVGNALALENRMERVRANWESWSAIRKAAVEAQREAA